MKHTELSDADCAIAQALSVVGDWWTLLVVRDIAGGVTRFDALQRELAVSRKTLTERLKSLVEHGVVERRQYSQHPPRFEYLLTDAGRGLLPVLIALQDWGTRHVTGDGSLTATTTPTSAEAARVHGLVGRKIPALTLTSDRGEPVEPVGGRWTVLYCFPGAFAPGGQGYPPGWADIPGAAGCTVESTTYRDRFADFDRLGAVVHGVSTQRPDQLRAFAEHVDLPFALLSDENLALAAGLRLPTFRAAGVDRFKRATLIVDPARTVRAVQFPVVDPAASVDEALAQLTYFE
ncbi:DNA-binding transcriptional regulator, HxlR family [Actinokineospora alba]|uniref:DNA-binding transcriptional regulator, HxlR family n=1 Tax=Actinokineospora alba TaxID=504798 RepID=A0A1H0U8U5_9PSEU|nr:winged helix-turn-helix transcriptional regulator [Actinokineospora alba]TDP65253.1 HxlR family transcriptional regulator [Actinokineospora alba]SDH58053.1 DNA-binding transcriptional regulator, HxlR family [Actinokineospora alba]SDP62722.1 DNA-binding transcriptional regulator, HxlR family [Actinokineospora alba]